MQVHYREGYRAGIILPPKVNSLVGGDKGSSRKTGVQATYRVSAVSSSTFGSSFPVSRATPMQETSLKRWLSNNLRPTERWISV
jgi:hypothetical protein